MEELCGALRGKVVLAGVGTLGRGDDGAGCVLARLLKSRGAVAALDCGDRPEDYTYDVAREEPATVLVADALDMGARPGDVALLEADDLPESGMDTHRASLRTFMEYLEYRTGARVLLVGIQPSTFGGEGLSPEVARSVAAVAAILTAARGPREGAVHGT
jgi:hydrogenase 3 maturation protease